MTALAGAAVTSAKHKRTNDTETANNADRNFMSQLPKATPHSTYFKSSRGCRIRFRRLATVPSQLRLTWSFLLPSQLPFYWDEWIYMPISRHSREGLVARQGRGKGTPPGRPDGSGDSQGRGVRTSPSLGLTSVASFRRGVA